MSRRILLIEPNYANKYPPIGLMKIATYHRQLGDEVRFFKGDLNDLVADYLFQKNLKSLRKIDGANWIKQQILVKNYLKTKDSVFLDGLHLHDESNLPAVKEKLDSIADVIKDGKHKSFPKFDRIYVTTLFTFYWKITVETINFCKKLVKKQNSLLVGGILATLLAEELEKEVGIKPVTGLLDEGSNLDPDIPEAKNIIIDNLPLDYSILDEIDYVYPTQSAYFTFMTKGCTRKCAFCSVPKLEPTYKPKIDTIDKFEKIKEQFGEQQNLLLMDNNVLASPNFDEIIDEIKAMGFVKGATFTEPNQLDIAIRNLQDGYNDYAFTRRAFQLIHALLPKLRKPTAIEYTRVLAEYQILLYETTTRENILAAYPFISEIYEKFRNKYPKRRYVDFNQGTDCRYITRENMAKMSEIPIRPLRIAFDHLSLKPKYIESVQLAAEYGITELSNYILYNFNDKPEDLWNRLKINSDLCVELGIAIFSFPMKYIPLYKEEAKNRKFVGKHWTRKYIRAVQAILNVSKGIVAPSRANEKTSFFEEAFGKNLDEFHKILYMPEIYITYRNVFRDEGYTKIWEEEFEQLTGADREIGLKIIHAGNFAMMEIDKYNPSATLKHFLRHYKIPRSVVDKRDERHAEVKDRFDRLIKEDQFLNLTLTNDYEKLVPSRTKIRRNASNQVLSFAID